ncbi:MAG: hypothetical protein HKN43_05025 [Rhodothermales bacterium]|nr:hypothetical protein [Rhodothermales bacterium]
MVTIPDHGASTRARTKKKRTGSGRRSMANVKPAAQPKKEVNSFIRRGASDHGALPTWKELEHRQNRRLQKGPRSNLFLETVSTAKVALLIIILAAGFTAYVGHVHATQELLATVQDMREENMRLHLKHNRIKGQYDKLTGPETIHRRAQELGLREGFAFGNEVIID